MNQREIKFRYRIQLATGEIHTEVVNLADLENGYLEEYLVPSCKILSRDEFAGLEDKNGKEIYEGDIILIDEDGRKYEVIFHQGVFGIIGGDSIHYPLRNFTKTGTSISERSIEKIEVIGSIYENPELCTQSS